MATKLEYPKNRERWQKWLREEWERTRRWLDLCVCGHIERAHRWCSEGRGEGVRWDLKWCWLCAETARDVWPCPRFRREREGRG